MNQPLSPSKVVLFVSLVLLVLHTDLASGWVLPKTDEKVESTPALHLVYLVAGGIVALVSLSAFLAGVCVSGGETPEMTVQRTTIKPPPSINYVNADFLEKHQGDINLGVILESVNDRRPNGTTPHHQGATQGGHRHGYDEHSTTDGVVEEQVFVSTGSNDEESFFQQCQSKAQTKREAAKLRTARRSSIIVSNLTATELRYFYVPPANDRRSLAPEKLYTKWEVAEITNAAPFDDAGGQRHPYWSPAATTDDILQQMCRYRFLEIPVSTLKIGSQLAKRETAITYKGEWHSPLGDFEVAIKSLGEKVAGEDILRLLREAATLGQFKHVNVVRFYGVVTLHEPMMCVTELLPGGDLKTHLEGYRLHMTTQAERSLLPSDLLKYCREVATGMRYLAAKGFIHRQLRAKNVLLSRNHICKICQIDTQTRSPGDGPSPRPLVRWSAPEVVLQQRCTFRSDVWSFGMVMFEIWSLGATPFDDVPNQKVLTLLNTGYCQPPPPGCPKPIYSIMVQCWNPEGKERPSFVEVLQMLQAVESTVLISKDKSKAKAASSSLGQPLKAGYQMYKDLQDMYM